MATNDVTQGTRRTVTVMFADVTGSTTLGEKLDPETLRRILARYYSEARSAVERHGGTIEKFIGDAVVGVFGVPRRHEDDPVRALRAAVEVRDRVRSMSAKLEARVGQRLEIRTGVNTGEVVSGDLSEGFFYASGDTMNVAARLEQAAAPDEILVGDATYRLVRDAVTAEPVEPFALKGKTQPVPAWRVLSIDPRAAGLARGLDAPLVGRREELTALLDAFARARDVPQCELVTVLGAAGAGKSRLVRELVAAVETEATVLRGRCLPYGEGITFWPIVEMIRDAAGIGDDESAAAARDKIAALVDGQEDQEAVGPRLADLLGLEGQAAGAIQETFLALRRLFQALAGEKPLALVVDDIHWAEPTLLDFIEYLAGWAREAPILLVCIARPELIEERPGWMVPRERVTVTVLQPLSAADSEELVAGLLGDDAPARELTKRITTAAEGNPLYVEEFVRMIRDDQRPGGQNGGGSSPRAELALPPTIEALLSARLDRLEAEERGVVERAAVVGKIFWWGAVAALSAPRRDAAVGSHLQALVRREFVVPETSTFAGEEAFRFSHLLMRDAAYGSIPKSARSRFHAAFAEWLARKAGERLPEYEEIVGYHFEQAFRYEKEVGEDDAYAAVLGEAASARLASAGRRAAQRADMRAAALLLERASRLAPQGGTRVEIQLDLGDCLIEAADFARAEQVLNDAREGAQALDSPRLQARAALVGLILRLAVNPSGWTRAAGAEVQAATVTLADAGDDVGLGHAHWVAGRVHWLNMGAAAAEVGLERALHHARNAGRGRDEARILTHAAFAAFLGPREAGAAITRCEALADRARGNPLAVASILLAKGSLRAMRGEVESGRADADRAKYLIAELDLPLALAEALQFCGILEHIVGDFGRAESELRRSCEVLEKVGERSLRSTSAGLLAGALCDKGDYEAAVDQTQIAEREGDQDDLATQELWRVARARCRAHVGNPSAAVALADEGVALIAESDFLNMRADGLVGQAEVLRLAGKTHKAEAALATAIELYQRKGNVMSARRARAVLNAPR
jgi:class 3 adenylate cyclase